MDPEGGMKAVENLRKAGNDKGKVYVVPGAGHHGECTRVCLVLC